MTLRVITGSWSDAVGFFQYLPAQHPAYYGLLWAWSQMGEGEAWLRSFSLILSSGALIVVAWLAAEAVSRSAGLLTSWLYAVSPFALYYATEARMYSMMILLSVVLVLLLLFYLREGKARHLWSYVLVGFLAIYTHFFFVLLVMALGIFALWTKRHEKKELVQTTTAHLLLALLFVPWMLLILLSDMPEGQSWKGAMHLVLSGPYTLLRFALGFGVVPIVFRWQSAIAETIRGDVWLLLAGMLGYIVCLSSLFLKRKHRERSESGRTETGLLVTQALGPFVITLLLAPIVILAGDRYFAVSFPAFLVLVGMGGASLLTSEARGNRLVGFLGVGLVLAATSTSTFRMLGNPRPGVDQWDSVARLLSVESHPNGSRVIVQPSAIASILRHYVAQEGSDIQVAAPASGNGGLGIRDSGASDRSAAQWLVLAGPQMNWDNVVDTTRWHLANGRCWLFPVGSGIRVFELRTDGTTFGDQEECEIVWNGRP